ncbi:hypothetical protein PR202_ga08486 [Eleusine coracana subsp. coracana]|uniref:Uncharacterized protein n=1 Tax=Eleusine coracana subsp. coracana TaxID=191504 RepID=A0AAV5C1W3_ELECO|nr:hypothetical protein QOZ80_1AG0044580 [Eleusine coracana subsp. coracana]GJM92059.1 hypothetical protein PR202_ga08486 [Eleusine coracana subsp. coracana]
MGSCASVHKEDSGFHNQKKLFLGSPQKAKAANGKAGGGVGVAPVADGFGDLKYKIAGEEQRPEFGRNSPNSGSKDEMFFESRAWLDSDCEDDFYSVNGDFTPSRGSTPNYQPRTQTVMTNVFQPDNIHNSKSSEPSPTGRKKLAELLKESMHSGSEENIDINEKQQAQSVAAVEKPVSESSSSCSMEPTPISVVKSRKEKAWYTGRCCLPSFVHSLSIDESENRQKMTPGPCAV